MLCLVALSAPGGALRAQVRHLAPSAVARTEVGGPQFQIRGNDALGLTSSPSDLHLLPDGRVLVIAGRMIAWGDGVRWTTFLQAPDEIPSVAVRAAVGPDGSIYLGTNGGIARVEFGEDGCWRRRVVATVFDEQTSAPSDDQRVVADVGNDWLWHGRSGPLRLWRPGTAVRLAGQLDQLAHVFTFRGARYASSQTTGALWRLEAEGMRLVTHTPDAWINDTVVSSVPFDADHLLVGTFGRGLWRFDGERLLPFACDGLLAAPARINALCAAGDGYFAAAVDSLGIVFFDRQGRVVQVADRTADPRLSSVRQLVAGEGGVIWGRLKDGIVRVRFPSPVSDFIPLFGSAIDTVNVCRYDSRLWFMGDGQVFRGVYNEVGRLTRLEVDSPPGAYVSSLSYAADRLLAGTNKGAFYWTEAGWVAFAPQARNLRVARADPVAGRWLYLADHEIGWLRPTADGFEIEAFPAPEVRRFFYLVQDAAGDVWVELGSGRVGRVRVREGRPELEVFGQADGLLPSWCQLFEVDGTARVNVAGRTLRFDEGTRRFVSDVEFLKRIPQGRPINCRPGRDASGRLWAVTDEVLHLYRETRGGLVADETAGLFTGHMPLFFAFEDDGVVWLQENCGLLRYDPNVPRPMEAPLRARITHVDLPSSERRILPRGGAIGDLPYGDKSLVAHFIAPGSPLDASVSFEVKLDGSDRDWNNVGGAGSAAFKNPGVGRHRLLVRPRLGDRVGEVDSLVFAVLPPWYRTWWAYLSYAAGVAGLAAAVAFMQRRKRRQLEQLVGERTAALNESNRQLERQLATIRTLSQAIEQSPTAVVLVRADRTVSYVNPRFCILCGERAETLVGGRVEDLYCETDATASFDEVEEALDDGKPWSGQLAHRRKDGSLSAVRAALSPIFDDHGAVLSHLILEEDISGWLADQEHQRKLEEQLFQSQKLESLGTLAGGIAHDFNNILTAILGSCELMQLSMPKDDPSEEYVSAIRAAGLRAKDLVSQILAFSRKRPANLLAIELAAPVKEALKLVRASAPATVELQATLAPGAIFADPTQIYRVVVNLCSNAIHALHDRCGRVSIEVAPCTLAGTRPAELHKLPPGDYMRLSVADNGHGMDAETLRRVFDPFFTTKAPGEGTGLGLAIVRNIVEGHGGAIHVRSEAGVGTTFELYFARTKEAPSAGATNTPVITAAVTHEVLVVDDEPAIVSYVSKRLAREGYRCATFADPGEALAVAQANPKRFDAIVTDLTMPRLTGVQLLQRLHREGPSLPSVIITGFSRELPETELATLPPCVVLQKPFTGDELVAALAQLLRPANPDARAGVVTAQVRER